VHFPVAIYIHEPLRGKKPNILAQNALKLAASQFNPLQKLNPGKITWDRSLCPWLGAIRDYTLLKKQRKNSKNQVQTRAILQPQRQAQRGLK
jgi:hypothetical protein